MIPTILVGYSGTDASLDAVRDAAFVSSQRHCRLVVASAFWAWSSERIRREQREAPSELHWAIGPAADAERLLAQARATAEMWACQGVETIAVEGSAASALPRLVDLLDPEMLVLGRGRSHGRMTGIARRLARRVGCPVVVDGEVVGRHRTATPQVMPVFDLRF